MVGEVSLSGRIDRIELGDGMFVIGDYKTGSTTPKLNDILEGRSLQLPLYVAVVEQLLKQQSSSVQGVGGVYYVLQEESGAELGIGDRDYNERAFHASRQNRQLLPNRWYEIEDTGADSDSDAFRAVVDVAVEHANQIRSLNRGRGFSTDLSRQDKGLPVLLLQTDLPCGCYWGRNVGLTDIRFLVAIGSRIPADML